ncbi:MAG TPA: PEP/pyruvate-binding domain-containing protein [Gemmataceae bacterium]|nr:PEP/pyruvate-binding domain-containing protein [Gemmataceae bacterium]
MSGDGTRQQWIYFFGDGQADGGSEVKHLVGGKGASLADMTKARLNVPPGFTISTECCDLYFRAGGQWPAGLEEAVRANLARLEQLVGRPFGRGGDPLLVAVRSGAAHSMPGMMDTVLNVGLNPDCVRAVAERTGNARGAWEAYRHFLVMFGHTVGGVGEGVFTDRIADLLKEVGKQSEGDLDTGQMEALCDRFREAYRSHAGRDLPTDPWDMLSQAIDAVFGSWHNERAVTYRRHHNIDGLLGTAVNVQAMCPSEVSGVMFTANPVNPALDQVLIESSYGLGEAIVLGKVTPDHFVLDKHTLQVVGRTISAKDVVISALARDGGGTTAARGAASLSDAQLTELGRLGQRVEAYFGVHCDIEWALSGGEFYLLQARAIKGLDRAAAIDPAERERVRREEIEALTAKAEPGGTAWARFNLAEILPEPTPMTWAIVRRFMSGQGGFGLTYHDLGYHPDPSLDEAGVYDLVCGRPYCNLSREPRLYARGQPFEHSFAALKAAPHKALYPQARPNWAKAGWAFWLFQPIHIWRSLRFELQLQRWVRTFADRLRGEIIPAFAAEATQGAAEDLTQLDDAALLQRMEHWIRRTLYDFARDSLKATVLGAVAMGKLELILTRPLGAERTRAALGELTMGVHADPEADLPGAVRDLSEGKIERAAFLERFGHRGPQEMELAQPRWSEDASALDQMTSKTHGLHPVGLPEDAWERIAAEAKLSSLKRQLIEPELKSLRAYLSLRETGKHYLMKGYALIRRILVELDRRHHLNGGIFFLTPEELPRLTKGEDLSKMIEERRRRRQMALSLEVPQVLFSDDLEAIGRAATEAGGDALQGVPLSAGVAEAPALVLEHPDGAAIPSEPYILVCPSTDPAWVPLFVGAKGLVMETGGVLSHGAIVAREFGLPAVAGLAGVHKRLKTGQRLRVDGGGGTVTVLDGGAARMG